MTKIVINRSPSTFLLSEAAIKNLSARTNNVVSMPNSAISRQQRPIVLSTGLTIRRDAPELVATVEELAARANAPDAELEIVTIPDGIDWLIGDVCGIEFVSAAGKVWPTKAERNE